MAVETHIHAFPRHVSSKTYPEAVPVYDSATKRIRVGDGSTVGGIEIPKMSDLTELSNAIGTFETAAEAVIGEESAGEE